MPKYLFHASYTLDGTKGLLKDGGSRRAEVVDDLVKSAGGNVDAFYFAFGETDVYVIADLPDEETAIAIALTVSATGAASVKTTTLIEPATVDAAVKRSVSYMPPGT